MNKQIQSNRIIEAVQIIFWVILCLMPPIFTYLANHDWHETWNAWVVTFKMQWPIAAIYFINFYLIVPYLLFRRKNFWLYVLINLALMALIGMYYYYPNTKQPEEVRSIIWSIIFASSIALVFFISCATGMRYVIHWNEMEEKRKDEARKSAEAELVWLKNQLNPHFLFNTLNNISSLIQVDADTAQESIGQLSDLLRYALYDSNKSEVPLASEVEFMRDYIALMRLRCNETAEIEVELPEQAPNVMVIPLLFISPIENAFKHGVNNRRPSFVHVRLAWEEGQILFQIENSRHPKAETDRVGSGIGIENLRRRLELAYPGRHAYRQSQTETTYLVTITIKP